MGFDDNPVHGPAKKAHHFHRAVFFHQASDWCLAFAGQLKRDGLVAAETETVVTATGMTGTAHTAFSKQRDRFLSHHSALKRNLFDFVANKRKQNLYA
eukprot:13677919-Ditylum_brightwellii.AAC.1